jgi:hypothetical protein
MPMMRKQTLLGILKYCPAERRATVKRPRQTTVNMTSIVFSYLGYHGSLMYADPIRRFK